MGDPTPGLPHVKRCRKCGQIKPLEAFNRMARSADGRKPRCGECTTAESARYRAEHGDEIRARRREDRARDPQKARERDRALRERHGDRIRERSREWARANMGQQVDYQRKRTAVLAALVFGHYGESCACCNSRERLTIDHINGLGREHREELYGSNKAAGRIFYLWLIRNDFPDGYQTLCMRCNVSKGRRERCTIKHRAKPTEAAA